MKLEKYGMSSCGKRTRHFNIKYFYITDLINRGEVKIKYCPTDLMIADYMTKPLIGYKFKKFRQLIMNLKEESTGKVMNSLSTQTVKRVQIKAPLSSRSVLAPKPKA